MLGYLDDKHVQMSGFKQRVNQRSSFRIGSILNPTRTFIIEFSIRQTF